MATTAPSGTAGQAGGGVITIAHANIKTTLPGPAFDEDLATTVASGPDLVSLNEVAHRGASDLVPPGYALWREGDAQQRGDDGTAVLWRTDRWAAMTHGRVILVDHGPQRWDHDRAATWVTLRDVASETTSAPTSAASTPGTTSATTSDTTSDTSVATPGQPEQTGPAGQGGQVGQGGQTGTVVSMVSAHQMINPARYGPDRPLRQQIYAAGMARLESLVAQLSTLGPVFVAGDFNSQYVADDPWGPRRTLGTVGLVSTMDTLGVRATHDGGGTIDYQFYPPASVTPDRQWTDGLHSDHRLLLTRFVLNRPHTTRALAPSGPFPGSPAVAGSDVEGRGAGNLDQTQYAHASAAIDEGLRLGVQPPGIVIALAVARQESGFRVYANDGRGHDLAPEQSQIADSIRLPHDAVGTDHGSLGMFQQQWPWWGPMVDLMDPVASSRLFYRALDAVPGWREMPAATAAQAVQRSAYPDAYDDDLAVAAGIFDERITDLASGSTPSAGLSSTSETSQAGATKVVGPGGGGGVAAGALTAQCPAGVGQDSWSPSGAQAASLSGSQWGSGAVVEPLAAGSGAVDLRNWGGAGSHWSRWHTGTDLSVSCGTPVRAAHDGVVHVDTGQAWSGPWLVTVARGPEQLTTWYAHMQAISVSDGQRVMAGEVLGEVGREGNATGCHLHFEVHLTGGSIYGPDNVNPSTWLEEHARPGPRGAP